MRNRICDVTWAFLATVALATAGYVSTTSVIVYAQASEPLGSISPMAEFAVRQGGALLVLLVVLFFYRRDYRYLSDYREQQFQVLVDLVGKNTQAFTDTASALRETATVVHQAKLVIRDRLPPGVS